MPSNAGKKSVDVIEVFDYLTGEDGVKRPSEVKVLGVRQLDSKSLLPEVLHGALVTVDSDQIAKVSTQESVNPVV
jgi:hypothetical protein